MDERVIVAPRSNEAARRGINGVGIRSRVAMPVQRGDAAFPSHARGELVTFKGLADGREHVAYLIEPWDDVPLVRVHSECLTGDVFGSMRCDCGPQLAEAIRRISVTGGIVLYLRQEGRGIGLYNKIDAYRLQDNGADTFEANRMLGRGEDERNYLVAAQMLNAIGVNRIRLLSNNDDKAMQLIECGIDVVSVESTATYLTPVNDGYLRAKVHHAGHHLNLTGGPA
jgi:GTP cyclohydrolase II